MYISVEICSSLNVKLTLQQWFQQMQGKNSTMSIKTLMKEAGITLQMVAAETGTSRTDVCRVLDDDLNNRIRSGAIKLIKAQNLKVANQIAEL